MKYRDPALHLHRASAATSTRTGGFLRGRLRSPAVSVGYFGGTGAVPLTWKIYLYADGKRFLFGYKKVDAITIHSTEVFKELDGYGMGYDGGAEITLAIKGGMTGPLMMKALVTNGDIEKSGWIAFGAYFTSMVTSFTTDYPTFVASSAPVVKVYRVGRVPGFGLTISQTWAPPA